MLKNMLRTGHRILALTWYLSTLSIICSGAALCTAGATKFIPCELSFALQSGDLPSGASAFKEDLLSVEFRSPKATTYLMHEFADDSNALHVRFTPVEAGLWTYKISSSIQRLDNNEGKFTVADSALTGMVGVANLRHFWTTGKRPHLWFAAEAPFLKMDEGAFESWLEARKKDGFTHIRGIAMDSSVALLTPLNSENQPNPRYFQELDRRLLAAAERGFTLDLILADSRLTKSVFLAKRDQIEPLVRYLAARYAGLNVTWQGVEQYDRQPGTRALLKDIGVALQKYDGFLHPRSTDAHDSSSPLVDDGWMNYLIEASANPQLGGVEHQFTQQPEIHLVQATEADAFRHELWNAGANGEYPSVSYAALENPANVKAAQIWFKTFSETRHWEFEPYFDVTGARAVGLNEVEYLAYAEKPGVVEITLPKHKYNPSWINPITGEESDLKDYRGEVFSRETPDRAHDWVLAVPRDGEKENLAKYYYFESQEPPVQEIEVDPAKTPFEIVKPADEAVSRNAVLAYSVKITRANRASRVMQYAWWGDTSDSPDGAKLLGLGSEGQFPSIAEWTGGAANLHIRVEAINANGKAYEVDQVLELKP